MDFVAFRKKTRIILTAPSYRQINPDNVPLLLSILWTFVIIFTTDCINSLSGGCQCYLCRQCLPCLYYSYTIWCLPNYYYRKPYRSTKIVPEKYNYSLLNRLNIPINRYFCSLIVPSIQYFRLLDSILCANHVMSKNHVDKTKNQHKFEIKFEKYC